MIRDVQITCPVSPARERRHRRAAREGLPMEFFGMVYFCLVILAGGILVWQPAKVAQMNEQIARLTISLQDLKLQSESLKKTVSVVESLNYVEKEAKSRLGMVSPQEVRTFSMAENANAPVQVASLPKEEAKSGGIFSLFGRIAQIFGAREAIAKGQR